MIVNFTSSAIASAGFAKRTMSASLLSPGRIPCFVKWFNECFRDLHQACFNDVVEGTYTHLDLLDRFEFSRSNRRLRGSAFDSLSWELAYSYVSPCR